MPDQFGFETPKEALARVRKGFAESREKVLSLGQSASPGVQFGSSLGVIFGPMIKKRLDTRRARKEERARLMQFGELSPEQATEVAKQRISPEFQEVRDAKKLESISATGRGIVDTLITNGVPPQRAQAVGMFEIAQRMSDAGMNQQASALRVQAGSILEEQGQKEAELANLKSRTAASAATAEKTLTELESDDDTYVQFSDDGQILDVQSMAVTDSEERESLRKQGYVNVGNNAFGVQFDRSAFADAPKTMSEAVQGKLIQGLGMLSGISTLKQISDQTGFIQGPFRNTLAKFGIELWDKEGFVDAVAVRKKMRADIQSLIDGIPSDYDAGVFEAIIPDPGAFQSRKLYDAQIGVLERQTQDLVRLTLEFHMGTDKPVPKAVQDAAFAAGIRLDEIAPLSEDEIQFIRANPSNNVFTNHQKEMEKQVELFQNTADSIQPDPERVKEDEDLRNFYTSP
jgi:hypothetical protein